jgi:hypothetical protein
MTPRQTEELTARLRTAIEEMLEFAVAPQIVSREEAGLQADA